MTAELIIHIGANKTASSSIQRFIQANQKPLTDLGYIIPDRDVGTSNEVTGEQVFGLQSFLQSKGQPAKRLKTRMEKIFDSRSNKSQKILLSAENMGTTRGAKLFSEVCATRKTKVVFYIRRQDDLIASSWQQWHSKTETDYGAFLLKSLRTLGNWENVINAWEKIVGKDNIRLGVFERNKFHNGDIIQDFIHKIGAHAHMDTFDIPEVNSNPSFFEYITPLVAGNKAIFQSIHDNDFYRVVEKLTGQTYSKGKKYSMMTRLQRDNIMKFFEGQNERIREKYFPDEKTLFAPINHSKYRYITEEQAADLQIKFLTHMVYEIGRRTV